MKTMRANFFLALAPLQTNFQLRLTKHGELMGMASYGNPDKIRTGRDVTVNIYHCYKKGGDRIKELYSLDNRGMVEVPKIYYKRLCSRLQNLSDITRYMDYTVVVLSGNGLKLLKVGG